MLLTALLVVATQVNAAVPYNEKLSTYLVDFAGAAYCGGNLGHGVAKWNCDACKKHPEVRNVTVISDTKTGTNGYIAAGYPTNTTKEHSIYVVFAGTDPLKLQTWIDDLQYDQVAWDLSDKRGCKKCAVDKGFLKAYSSVGDQVRENLAKYWDAIPAVLPRRLFFIGHSLGAAIVLFAALDAIRMLQDGELSPLLDPDGIEVYTFGEPRIGNKEFAEFTSRTLTSHYRQVHHVDPVPHLPPEDPVPIVDEYHYRHPAREVFYKSDPTKYRICDGSGEDPKCSDQYLLDLNLLDHLNYMNFDFIGNYLGCKLN